MREFLRLRAIRCLELFGTTKILHVQLTLEQTQRVEQLMMVPFDKLDEDDVLMRSILGPQRLKAALCRTAWYSRAAAKAAEDGDEMEYWAGLWHSQVNLVHPRESGFTAETTGL